MEAFELILILLAAILCSTVLDQIIPKISAPLIQIALGFSIALFWIPTNEVQVDPQLFLVLFIAPLLFDESRHVNTTYLWKNRGSILALAIGLVVALTLSVGFILHALIPSMTLAAAFALGAALGPTDAVAVSSLSKEVRLTHRQSSLLAGESLINDASGVVSFQFAIAACVTGAFSLVDAGISFGISFFGGIILGVLLGQLASFIICRVRRLGLENTTFHVLFEMFIPFMIFLLSESLHVSGILAVVAAGLIMSYAPKGVGPSISRHHIVSSSAWSILTYTLNGLVFVLLGMQLPRAMRQTWEGMDMNNFDLVLLVLILTVVVTLVRFAWLLVTEYLFEKKNPLSYQSKGEFLRNVAVTTLAGPKGAITLSIAFTIPYMLESGELFPYRELLIFLASGVILCTLVLATFVTPLLAPALECPSSKQTAQVNIEILRRVVDSIAQKQTEENRAAVQQVIKSYNARIARIQASNNLESEDEGRLRVKILRIQQDYILREIEENRIDPVLGVEQIQRLAQVQNLIKHHRNNTWLIRNALRHLRITVLVAWHTVLEKLPGAKVSTRAQERRELLIICQELALSFLRSPAAAEKYPSEIVSDLIAEQEGILRTIYASDKRPSVTVLTSRPDKARELKRDALRVELEQIQEEYEAGNLNRQAAKQLRENVYLMQIDLEQQV